MKFKGELFNVYLDPAKTPEKGRIMVVVGVKVSKKAVIRNKIKRQIREIIRLCRFNFSGSVLKIIVSERALGKKYGRLKKDLESILKTTQ